MEKPDKNDLLPDIRSYLKKIDFRAPIDLKYLNQIIFNISSKTGIKEDIVKIILQTFLQEIRYQVLNGKIVTINKLGRIYISSPLVSENKKQIFIKFESGKNLLKKING